MDDLAHRPHSTGVQNAPAPATGRGLECDKLSQEAAEAMFAGLMGKLIADNRPLVGQEKTLVSTHIDSWEVGSQNWTPKFRVEFQRLRGYDPLPFLPVMTAPSSTTTPCPITSSRAWISPRMSSSGAMAPPKARCPLPRSRRRSSLRLL